MNYVLHWTIVTLLLVVTCLLAVTLFQALTIAEYHTQVKEWQALFTRQHAQTTEALAAWDHCRAQTQKLRVP